MKLLTPSHALSQRSYQLRSSPVRVEALNLTTDTVTILSLFGPTGKRGACGSTCQTPFCSSLPTVLFNMVILTTCVTALIIITLTLRIVPLIVSYILDYSRSNAEGVLPIFAASSVKHVHQGSYLCSKLFHLLFKLLH